MDLLSHAAQLRVYFGHQSVGLNVLEAIPALYAGYGLTPPTRAGIPGWASDTVAFDDGPVLADEDIGTNGAPDTKLSAFEKRVDMEGPNIDVALMKFCFLDISDTTDVTALFASYRDTMARLETRFPNTTFLYTTAVLTNYNQGATHLARERYNALVRAEYAGTGRLLDLAKIESTRPDGTRVAGTYDGQTYYMLYDGYSDDGGHLNPTGAALVADALMRLVGSQ